MNKSTFLNLIERPWPRRAIDFAIVFPFLVLPLLVHLPYRVNIFLSWDASYRLMIGQTPYSDFGLPMGIGFWLIPTLFFKLFGPTFLTLVKAQVFINLLSVLVLRGILYNLSIRPLVVTMTLLVFCLTYVIYNFWPWYNHSVIVYEMIALYFVTLYAKIETNWKRYTSLLLAGFFTFISLYTKQDMGGLCFLISLYLIAYVSWTEKKFLPLIIYVAAFAITAVALIGPFVDDGFGYWFNHGQPPHSSRISLGLLLDILLSYAIVEKLYVVGILVGLLLTAGSFKSFFENKNMFLAVSIFAAIILQSLVQRMTSPLPTDHMTYYHAFGFVGLCLFLPWEKWASKFIFVVLIGGVLLATYSAGYAKYVSGLFPAPKSDDGSVAVASKPWVEGYLPTFKKVMVPEGTNEGIKKIMALPFLKKTDLKVLNMSELTSLAYEIPYTPDTGTPLWFHMGIGMFQKQVDEINQRIRNGYYDIVLFQSIESLPTFYPAAIGEELRKDYVRYDQFIAPRRLEDSQIEVFIRPDLATQYQLSPASDPTN